MEVEVVISPIKDVHMSEPMKRALLAQFNDSARDDDVRTPRSTRSRLSAGDAKLGASDARLNASDAKLTPATARLSPAAVRLSPISPLTPPRYCH